MHSLLQSLLQLDYRIWRRINITWHNSILDVLAPIFRNPYTWAPLYAFLAVFIPWKFKKSGLYWCLGFLITFALSDYTSASLIKPYVHRIRPCNDGALRAGMHLLVDCGSGYSFPSAHAANHFGLALFMSLTLRHQYKWIWVPAFLWAFSVAYAQVYVGVHFPLDVTCGALLGLLAGTITGLFFDRKIGLAAARRR